MTKKIKINLGKENYNVFTNNCGDAVENPITEATGVTFSDKYVPNSNFK